MKSTGVQRVTASDHPMPQQGVRSHSWRGSASINDRIAMDKYQERRPLSLRKTRSQRLLDQPALHSVAKTAKLMPRFTRIQVLSIIKLATMDKLRESGAGDDPTTQQRLATDGQGGTAAVAAAGGEGTSDEYHHQFYNTGRIGRRNALPDILGTHCTTTTADLSSQLGSLSTSDCAGKASDGSSSCIAAGNNGQPPPTTTAT
ncbi:AGAP001779-PB [Anopheles gambiae str. PEST]|uniref:AGAP001779-PB n=2 Tax=Anopheles gambiae TaxID=7165 RepID=A0NHD6_ANOGA|nr:AGAP001779-PB [Anopheles gambiae str. PEST]